MILEGKAKLQWIFPCVNLEFRFTDDSDIFATCLQHVEDRFTKTGTLGLVCGPKKQMITLVLLMEEILQQLIHR